MNFFKWRARFASKSAECSFANQNWKVLVKRIVLHLKPSSLLCHQKFILFCKCIYKPFREPKRASISRRIIVMYNIMKGDIESVLKMRGGDVRLTADAWPSCVYERWSSILEIVSKSFTARQVLSSVPHRIQEGFIFVSPHEKPVI